MVDLDELRTLITRLKRQHSGLEEQRAEIRSVLSSLEAAWSGTAQPVLATSVAQVDESLAASVDGLAQLSSFLERVVSAYEAIDQRAAGALDA